MPTIARVGFMMNPSAAGTLGGTPVLVPVLSYTLLHYGLTMPTNI